MYGRQQGVKVPFSRFFWQERQHAVIAGEQWNKLGVRGCCQKGLDLPDAFLREDGARGVKHPPARTEEGPERLEEPFLFGGQLFDVIGSAKPWRIGLATHHAACRTGRIKQNAVKRSAVPPAFDVAGVCRSNVGLELETVKGFSNFDGSGRIDFLGRHGAVGEL